MADDETTSPATSPDKDTDPLKRKKFSDQDIINLSKKMDDADFAYNFLKTALDVEALADSPSSADMIQQIAAAGLFGKRTNPAAQAAVVHINDKIVDLLYDRGDELFNYVMDQTHLDLTANPELIYVNGNNEADKKALAAAMGADPIDYYNGAFNYDTTDFSIDGAGINFHFIRHYTQFTSFNGCLGYKWDHCYNLRLRFTSDQNIIYRSNGECREIIYRRHTVHDYWFADQGDDGIIVQNNENYIYRTPNGTEISYSSAFSLYAGIYLLEKITDRFGNYLLFSYDDGLLDTVEVNHATRVVRFSYDDYGRIIEIRDFASRSWTYYYDDYGDLVAATSPATDEYKSGLTTEYDYSSAQYESTDMQHNLTTIYDATGQPFLENEYGTDAGLQNYNRVIRQRLGGGEYILDYQNVVEDFQFSYPVYEEPTSQTVVRNPDGVESRYLFNQFGNMLLRESWAIVDGVPQIIEYHYRYNRDGNLQGTLSPEGSLVQFVYGRDQYERTITDMNDYAATNDPDLDQKTRQGFLRMIASVKRGKYYSVTSLNTTNGLWSGDIFPDVFSVNAEDIIQKFSFEADYGQPLSISDPRYTASPDPDFHETQVYGDTLTRYNYTANAQSLYFQLSETVLPAAKNPDGISPGTATTSFTSYDVRGRQLKTINPSGLLTESVYYDEGSGTVSGMLRQVIQDPEGINLRKQWDLDLLGQKIKTYDPAYFISSDQRYTSTAEYNALGQVTKLVSGPPISTVVSRRYNKAGNLIEQITEVKDPSGILNDDLVMIARREYDGGFNVIKSSETNRSGSLSRNNKFVYDVAGRLCLSMSSMKRMSRWMYNDRSLPYKEISDWGGIGVKSAKYYDSDARLTRSLDVRRGTYRTKYDALGRIIISEDAIGNRVYKTYDKLGNIVLERSFEPAATNQYRLIKRNASEYNERGLLIRKMDNCFDPLTETTADPEAAYLTNGPGIILTELLFYDSAGRMIKNLDQRSQTSTIQYDVLGRVTKKTDPYGNEVRTLYDTAGNIIRVDRTELIRSAQTNAVTGQRCFASTHVYDERRRLIQTTDSLGNKTTFSYDSRGLMQSKTDPLGNKHDYINDLFGRLVQTTEYLPDPVHVKYEFDQDDLLVAQTDALDRKTEFRNNGLGKRYSTIFPDSSADFLEMDFSGMVKSYLDQRGIRKIFARDLFGRIIEQEIDDSAMTSGLKPEGSKSSFYVFDAAGRIIRTGNESATYQYSFNSVGWMTTDELMTAETGLTGHTARTGRITRSYYENGTLQSIVYPSGRRLEYETDLLNRVTTIKQTAKSSSYPGDPLTPAVYTMATIEHEGLQRIKMIRANGSESGFAYDASGRMININHRLNNSTFLQIQQFYDGGGNLRQKKESAADFKNTNVYTYDALYRLRLVSKKQTALMSDLSSLAPPAAPVADIIPDIQLQIDNMIETPGAGLEYLYDMAGNRTAVEDNHMPLASYTSNALDQYSQAGSEIFVYDPNGNLTEDNDFRYIYNYENRLTGVEKKSGNERLVTYVYDVHGNKIFEIAGSQVKQHFFSGIHDIETYTDNLLTQMTVPDMGIDNILQVAAGGKDCWLFADGGKSVRYVYSGNVKQNFYVYDEYGKIISGTPAGINPYLFHAKKLISNLNKYDFFSRILDPETGRFMQRDTAGYADGTNLYSYTGNNPTSFTDSFGQSRSEHDGSTRYIEVTGDINAWSPGDHTEIRKFITAGIVGGRGTNANWRYLTLKKNQEFARQLMDEGLGCTLCHITTQVWNTYGKRAVDPVNQLPYDWAIDRDGYSGWVDMSNRARFLVEGMTMIAGAKVNADTYFMNNTQPRPLIQTEVYPTDLVNREVEALRQMAKQPLTRLDRRLYYISLPEAHIYYREVMNGSPGDANFLRFGFEWAQDEFRPLVVGERHSLDTNARRRAGRWMDRNGYDRTGRSAMHPLDSAANPYIDPNGTIGSTYYFGDSSVNSSFGSQLGHEITRLGLKPGKEFRLSLHDFPGYNVAPPTAPPSSPSGI